MSKYRKEAERLRAIVSPHYNCAQSVLLPFAEDAGLDRAQAMQLAANFGQGMRMASVCGAVTGGLMVLGLFGIEDPKILAGFYRRVRENHEGYLDCGNLLRINKEHGGARKPHCDAMVYECVGIVEDILTSCGRI